MGLKKNENDGPICTFVKGGLTGFIEAIICYPTEFVKTQLQLQSKANPEYSGMLDCARKTVSQHGPQGLYRGALPLILGSSGKQAARWTGYETAANAMKDDQGKLTIPKRMLAGACGGVSEAIFAVTPIETLKTRVTDDVRRGTKNYTGSFDAVVKILKSEGPSGLYMGLVNSSSDGWLRKKLLNIHRKKGEKHPGKICVFADEKQSSKLELYFKLRAKELKSTEFWKRKPDPFFVVSRTKVVGTDEYDCEEVEQKGYSSGWFPAIEAKWLAEPAMPGMETQ
eukprot:g2970.t1